MRRVLGQRVCSQTSAQQFSGSEFLARCGVRGDGKTVTSATKQTRSVQRTKVGSSRTEMSDAIAGGLFVWKCPRSCQAWDLPETNVSDKLWKSVVVFSSGCLCIGRSRRDNKNPGEKRVDIHDQQRESSQNLEHALQSSHQARLAERNTLRHLRCERAVQQILKIERWNLVQRLATSYVDTSLDRGSREFERT